MSEAIFPLSPHEEGYLEGIRTSAADESVLHFDGADHVSTELPDSTDEKLADRPDFNEGLFEGLAARRKLERLGYSITKMETMEELLAYSHGGSE